jgi:Putative peptidoglycan binding domain
MNIGLRPGALGADVERLHSILRSEAREIDSGELDRREFGPSTLAALHAFQSQHGLSPTEAIDAATLEILLRFEQNITINIYEGAPPRPPSAEPASRNRARKTRRRGRGADRQYGGGARRKTDPDRDPARELQDQRNRPIHNYLRAKERAQPHHPGIGGDGSRRRRIRDGPLQHPRKSRSTSRPRRMASAHALDICRPEPRDRSAIAENALAGFEGQQGQPRP